VPVPADERRVVAVPDERRDGAVPDDRRDGAVPDDRRDGDAGEPERPLGLRVARSVDRVAERPGRLARPRRLPVVERPDPPPFVMAWPRGTA
jgi:hypothetical protein